MQFTARQVFRSAAGATVSCLLMLIVASCGDGSCPDGYYKEGKICKPAHETDANDASPSPEGTQTVGATAAGAVATGASGGMAGPSGASGSAATNAVLAAGAAASMMSTGAGASGGVSVPVQVSCSPITEQCDNRDNDCDGKVDEAVIRSCGSAPEGLCKPGTEQCLGGNWSGTCVGAVGPTAEVCDQLHLDENCNGVKNEGCGCSAGEPVACGKFDGICRQGMQSCVNGQWGAECIGKFDPMSPELCDGASLDEDCDGRIDEGCECIDQTPASCSDGGLGECAAGTKRCTLGKWGACISNNAKNLKRVMARTMIATAWWTTLPARATCVA